MKWSWFYLVSIGMAVFLGAFHQPNLGLPYWTWFVWAAFFAGRLIGNQDDAIKTQQREDA